MASVDVNLPARSQAITPVFFVYLRTHAWLPALLLMAATFAVYLPVRGHPFFGMDDYEYVVNNLHIRDGVSWSTVRWAFTSVYAANWHPLTWLSHAVDIQIFKLNPAGPHVENALLHAMNAALLFWVLLRATGYLGRSWMVAALFALHPINVEPVVWVAERKTMLCMLFFLLTLAAYRHYASTPARVTAVLARDSEVQGRYVRLSLAGRYLLVALLFICGLMAKPQVVMLPVVLLLWDYWPLQRMFATGRQSPLEPEHVTALPPRKLSWLILEKLPLLLMCVVGAVVTLHAQSKGIVVLSLQERLSPWNWGPKLPMRLENAVLSYAKYIGKAFWPSALAPEYPFRGESQHHWYVFGASVLLVAVTVLVMAGWRHRYLLTGWLWFLIMLVPMIGIVQAGRQAMADRYAYISFVGLFIMLCWGVADLTAMTRRRRGASDPGQASAGRYLSAAILPCASVLVLLVLTTLTYRQIGYWKDDLTLWTHAAQAVKSHWQAEDNVGRGLLAMGRPEAEAMPHFLRAAQIFPLDPTSNLYIASYEQQHGNLRAAIQHYKNALANLGSDTDKAAVYRNMGVAYRDLGDLRKAGECFAMSAAFKSQ